MQTHVLLSIKPEYAESIFDGTKRYEFRRKLFSDRSVQKIIVYVTAPVSMVLGEFEIEDIMELEPESLWDETKEFSGIAKPLFDTYFVGKETGFAIKIGKTQQYDIPLDLKAHFNVKQAPQSFVYIRQ